MTDQHEEPILQPAPLDVDEEMAVNHYRSRSIGQLAAALAEVQQKITDAQLDGFNPYHRSKYASLSSVWQVARSALAGSGIAVLQFPATNVDAGIVSLETQLVHKSGEFVSSVISARVGAMDERQNDDGQQVKNKNLAGVQKLGGAITYLRRYALTSMLGICSDEDTDGNTAGQQKEAEDRRKRAQAEAEGKKAAQASGKAEKAHSGQASGQNSTVKPLPPKCSSALWGEFTKLYKRATENILQYSDDQFAELMQGLMGNVRFREWDDATMRKACDLLNAKLDTREEAEAIQAEQAQGAAQ